MSLKAIFSIALVTFSLCAHAQEIFSMRVDSFETILKKFQDANYQPENKCYEFINKKYQLNSFSLYVGSAHCFRERSWQDSAILLAMADIRLIFDQTRFPVDNHDKAALSNAVAIRSLAFSHYGNEYIYEGDNDTVANISRSIREWKMDKNGSASPGWQHLKGSLSMKELSDLWTYVINSKIANLDSAAYFLRDKELAVSRRNWLAIYRNIEDLERQQIKSSDDSERLRFIRQNLQKQKADQENIYFQLIDKLDDKKRPYIKNFDGQINISDLMKINPATLNPINELRGKILLSRSESDVRHIKISLDNYQLSFASLDSMHFLSLCIANLVARTENGYAGWQIGTDQENLDKFEFAVKLLKPDEEPLKGHKLKFLDPVWLKHTNINESCNFMRHGYLSSLIFESSND
jgi:hypothetical protein